ncbi:MAG TPA: phytanoyl-CoA dioxygenase family protein [Acidimicrobiales bacterium]|nr:phytanoyl-CoA dioxygenase family protein [Acidimicrobiales bacterium]
MTTIDFRTRPVTRAAPLELDEFIGRLIGDPLRFHGATAALAAARLALTPLTIEVEGRTVTIEPADGRIDLQEGIGEGVVVQLDPASLGELIEDAASAFGLQMTGRAKVARGAVDSFVAWEPVLRTLFDGRPVYQPGTIRFRTVDGADLDPRTRFTLDDDHATIGHFLAEAGFLHIEGVFTEAEMAAVSQELDDAVVSAQRDDGASWWARTKNGDWYPSRILGFNQMSPSLRELLHCDRFAAIGRLTDDRFVQPDPDRGDSAEGLLKKVGVVEGISDVSWHKDCAMGGHSRHCCGLTVGISVTGAQRENGELGVVAGSHRANVSPLGIEGLDLPRIPLPTRTGDITVHCSCTLHMSRPPVSDERRVVYTGFSLAPRPGDAASEQSDAEIRRERASLNDHTRRRQQEHSLGAASTSFEL